MTEGKKKSCGFVKKTTVLLILLIATFLTITAVRGVWFMADLGAYSANAEELIDVTPLLITTVSKLLIDSDHGLDVISPLP